MADRKYELQNNLLDLRSEEYEPARNNADDMVRELSQLDLKVLMYDKSKKRPDEKLLEHYRDLRDSFDCINAYDKAVSALKRKENPTERDKAMCIREEAHLRTLLDIRSYYQVMEELMLNRYYALSLPSAVWLKTTSRMTSIPFSWKVWMVFFNSSASMPRGPVSAYPALGAKKFTVE